MDREVCWITNDTFVAKSIREGNDPKILNGLKRGMIRKCIHDRMIKDEFDKYICYAVDDDDWRQEGDEAWDDVTGKRLDPDKVREARKEEIQEYHEHEVYERDLYQNAWRRQVRYRYQLGG